MNDWLEYTNAIVKLKSHCPSPWRSINCLLCLVDIDSGGSSSIPGKLLSRKTVSVLLKQYLFFSSLKNSILSILSSYVISL